MAVNPNPIKDSRRSKRRAKRGFVSLEVSSRKHRRANKRLLINLTHGKPSVGTPMQTGKPGETIKAGDWLHKCGGSVKYW